MASYPDFEPANYTEESIDVWRNNALAIVYEPGSPSFSRANEQKRQLATQTLVASSRML